MAGRLPNLRKALIAYDPQAKLVRSITTIAPGTHRVEYVDKAGEAWHFIFREAD